MKGGGTHSRQNKRLKPNGLVRRARLANNWCLTLFFSLPRMSTTRTRNQLFWSRQTIVLQEATYVGVAREVVRERNIDLFVRVVTSVDKRFQSKRSKSG